MAVVDALVHAADYTHAPADPLVAK